MNAIGTRTLPITSLRKQSDRQSCLSYFGGRSGGSIWTPKCSWILRVELGRLQVGGRVWRLCERPGRVGVPGGFRSGPFAELLSSPLGAFAPG